jgi:amidase
MTTTSSIALAGAAAAQLAEMVCTGQTTALAVAEAHLERIAALNPRLCAFELVDPARVRAEAASVDASPNRADLPLAGVPIAIKDNMAATGYPARNGSLASSTAVAEHDDEIVRQVRAAGAVIIGVGRMPELAAWPFTQSRLGISRQPDDPALDPGGSTGGGAVAVATGMAAAALGTDGGGSIRVPAAFCGLVGVKPGRGVLPLPGDLAEHWYGLTQSGFLTRTVADAQLISAVLAGNPLRDSAGERDQTDRPDRPDQQRRRIEAEPGIGVAVSVKIPSPFTKLTPHNLAAVRAAEAILAEAGPRTERREPPYPAMIIPRWMKYWQAGIADDVERLGLAIADLEPRTAQLARKGRTVLRRGGPDRRVAAGWRDTMVRWLTDTATDVVLLPATAGDPLPAGSMIGKGYLRTLIVVGAAIPLTQAWNLSGLPALVVPVRVGGRTVGVQLVGRPGGESTLLSVAAALEAAR